MYTPDALNWRFSKMTNGPAWVTGIPAYRAGREVRSDRFSMYDYHPDI
jgi:hypothetical protein